MLNKFLMRLLQKRLINNYNIISYINNNELIKDSKVFQGTLYEYTVIRELEEKLLMNHLKKVGGVNDGGVDILGKWPINKLYTSMKQKGLIDTEVRVPKRFKINGRSAKPIYTRLAEQEDIKKIKSLDVLVQCKAFSMTKIGPKHIREVVGTYWSKVLPIKYNSTLIMICSPHLLTKECLKLINSISIPLLYVRVEMLKNKNGEYDLEKSGSLVNYYENEYASKLLENLEINKWLQLKAYKDIE